MNRAMVLLDTGVNSALAPTRLPGKGTSTIVGLDASFGPTPWFTAYSDRYWAQWSAKLNWEPLGVNPILTGVSCRYAGVHEEKTCNGIWTNFAPCPFLPFRRCVEKFAVRWVDNSFGVAGREPVHQVLGQGRRERPSGYVNAISLIISIRKLVSVCDLSWYSLVFLQEMSQTADQDTAGCGR